MTIITTAALLDDNASHEQLVKGIIGNAVKRAPGGPVADSRQIAEVFGKRHADVLRSIDTILKRQPDYKRNFASVIDTFTNGKGGQQTRRAFALDRTAFNLLVLGFTGERAFRYRAAFVTAFERMAENERREQWDMVSSWKPNPSRLTPAQRNAIAHKNAAQRVAQRAAKRGPDDIF